MQRAGRTFPARYVSVLNVGYVSRDGHILGKRTAFRDSEMIFAEPVNMKLYGLVHVLFCLLAGSTGCHTSGNIGRVSGKTGIGRLNDHQKTAHDLFSLIISRIFMAEILSQAPETFNRSRSTVEIPLVPLGPLFGSPLPKGDEKIMNASGPGELPGLLCFARLVFFVNWVNIRA